MNTQMMQRLGFLCGFSAFLALNPLVLAQRQPRPGHLAAAVAPLSATITESVDQTSEPVVDPDLSQSAFVLQNAVFEVRWNQSEQNLALRDVLVGVIDTGIDAAHPFLAGAVSPLGWDFVDNDANPNDEFDGLDNNHDGRIDEAAGHGTFIAGLIRLFSPNAKIMALRAFNSDGVGNIGKISAAIRYAVDHGCEVINLSFNYEHDSAALRGALDYAAAHGVVLIASAGNANQNHVSRLPAGHADVLAIAAVTSNNRKAAFSNYDITEPVSKVAFTAPGVNVVSIYPGNRYARWSGTSFSAAITSGQVAYIMAIAFDPDEHEDMTPAEAAVHALDHAAIDNRSDPYREYLGEGRIDSPDSICYYLFGGGDCD